MDRVERCAGGIVLGDSGTIAVVKNRPGGWFFPKGHIEAGEDDEAAARREIQEECGLANLELLDDLGSYQRPNIRPDDTYGAVTKDIHMYLFAAEPHSVIRADAEIEEAAWISLAHLGKELADTRDAAWFTTVFERVRQAVQRD